MDRTSVVEGVRILKVDGTSFAGIYGASVVVEARRAERSEFEKDFVRAQAVGRGVSDLGEFALAFSMVAWSRRGLEAVAVATRGSQDVIARLTRRSCSLGRWQAVGSVVAEPGGFAFAFKMVALRRRGLEVVDSRGG